ncbi:MAG: DUF4097 family beta strand repeat protein [Clostridia bacterium]|nr:DUF4097 family beta strand repeat protein [Clostridia bacterium]
MKNRSKVFLVISLIIVVIGVVICYMGTRTASATGEQIYAAKIGEDRVYTYTFGGEEESVDKVKINVGDANVNIYGKSESSYMEIINFNENNSSYSANNSVVSFKEPTQGSGVTGIFENGISFKGLRFLLRPVPADKQKTVNIYIAKDENVKAFDIKLLRGKVTVENMESLSDYHVTIQSGGVQFSKVSTESTISINASGELSTDINFKEVRADIVSVMAKHAKFFTEADSFTVNECTLEISNGETDFRFVPMYEQYTIDVTSKKVIYVDGEYIDGESGGDKFVYPPKDENAPAPEEETEDSEEGEEEGEEEEIKISSLVISGDDLYVKLRTPASVPTEAPEDTTAETAVQ